MDKRQLLDEALARGIISDTQRKAMSDVAGEDKSDSEERFKAVSNLNEIFVTVGVWLLLAAITGLIGLAVKDPASISILGAGVAWLVALYFHKGRRFRLPLILCMINAAFGIGIGFSIMMASGGGLFEGDQAMWLSVIPMLGGLLVLSAGAWRFRLPFLMLPISILFTVCITYAAKYTDDTISYRLILGAAGLTILAMAIRFDLKDPTRVTRWSDFAFWSYVVGSPLFVHSLFLSVLIAGSKEWAMSFPAWFAMLALTLVVSFVGIVLNRRALIISTLIYVVYLLSRPLLVIASTPPLTALFVVMLILGLYVTCLGSRWRRVRAYVMKKLPAWAWLKHLPPAA